jgi:Kef-type K+ transport system membrane component KefB
VTTLRDFFVTLFFVGLGMTIPVPTWSLLALMLIVSMFLVVSRILTVFIPLHFMRLGHRVSLLPAINLCQISELSLVLLTLGAASGDVSIKSISVAAFAFAFLAVDSTYTILKNDEILRRTSPWLKKLGFRDFEADTPVADGQAAPSIFLLGFSWVASSLLEEISRNRPALLPQIRVVDYNPHVFERLRGRGVQVVYGDISQRETLLHAGLAQAKIIVCSLPDTVLKGSNNLRLLRHVRELNPDAQTIVHANRLADVAELYAANASYVTTPRLLEATHLLEVLEAAEKGMLDQKRNQQQEQLLEREEVIP